MKHIKLVVIVLWCFASLAVAQDSAPARIVMGGRAVAMVANTVYAFPGMAERVVAVGGTDQGLGTFLEAIAPGFTEKPNLDRNAGAEDYAALRPDLVILKSAMRSRIGAGLDTLNIPSLYLELESPEDYYRDLATLGRVLGQPQRAQELIDYYQATVRKAATIAGSGQARNERIVSVLVVQSGPNGLMIPPDAWIQTRLVELAGAWPVWKGSNPSGGWLQVSLEQVAAWQPERIILIAYDQPIDTAIAAFKADQRYRLLRAVRENRVAGFPQDFYSWDQPDPRWALGLLWLTAELHPTRGAAIDILAETRSFFQLFYGLDRSGFDRHILPRLSGL